MSLRWYTTVIDSKDVAAQGRWWAEALDWRIAHEADDEVILVPPFAFTDAAQNMPVEQRGPGLVFISSSHDKTVKNRLHIELAPGAADDQAAEVERLVSLGARHVDVGQSAESSWVVLADPEGNEFCVLSPRDT